MSSFPLCKIAGCKNPAQVRGLCRPDYRRHYEAGTLDAVALPSTQGKSTRARIVTPERAPVSEKGSRADMIVDIRRRADALTVLEGLPKPGAPLPVSISFDPALPPDAAERLLRCGQRAMEEEVHALRAEMEIVAFGASAPPPLEEASNKKSRKAAEQQVF